MTQEQIKSGVLFAVYGLPYDLQYNVEDKKLELVNHHTVIHRTELVADENTFTAFLPAFGVMQPVEVAYSFCETKNAPQI